MQQFIFKWRGAIMTPFALLMIWFAKPTILSVALGLILAVMGEGIRIWALGYAGEHTRRQELEAPELITAGPYSLVRNPLYCGNILNAMGVTVAACGAYDPSTQLMMLMSGILVLYLVYGNIVELEEAFLREKFGQAYVDYCENVSALFPTRLKFIPGNGTFCIKTASQFETATLLWWSAIWGHFLYRVIG